MTTMIEKIKNWGKMPNFTYSKEDALEYFLSEDYSSKELQWKKQNPVKYFVWEYIPDVYCTLKWHIKEFWWNLKYTFVPKYKYHLLRLNKAGTVYQKGWIDADHQIMLANFLILKNYVENELFHLYKLNSLSEIIFSLEKDKDDILVQKEIRYLYTIKELYDYWLERSKTFMSLDDIVDQEEIYVKDTEMLCKLITIRSHMWT